MKARVHQQMLDKMDTGVRADHGLNASLQHLMSSRGAKTSALKKIVGSPDSAAHLFGDINSSDEEAPPLPAERIPKASASGAKKASATVPPPKAVKAPKPKGTSAAEPKDAMSQMKLKAAEAKRMQKLLEEERAEIEEAKRVRALPPSPSPAVVAVGCVLLSLTA